jgi:hypothetical protein
MRPLDSVTRRADSASNLTRRLLWSPDANPAFRRPGSAVEKTGGGLAGAGDYASSESEVRVRT